MPRRRRWRRLPEIDKLMIKHLKKQVKEGAAPQRALSESIHSFQSMRDFLTAEEGTAEFLAVHGLVRLTPVEQELVETRAFGRLGSVKQLETVESGFYPGASHTRLAHSLGVLHLTGRIAKRLKLPKKQQQELRIAALLHDAGHPAFSHGLESFLERELGADHERVVEQRLRLEGLDKLVKQRGYDYDRILAHIHGEGLGEIITDFADRIDYLQRDVLHSGVGSKKLGKQMQAVLNKIISNMALKDGQVCVREEATDALEAYARYRNLLSATLYYHPASMIARDLLRRAVEKGLRGKHISVQDFFEPDETLLRKMDEARIPEANALRWHAPVHWTFEPVFQTRFTSLNERGRRTVQTPGFKKMLEEKLAETMPRENFVVAITPDFEKTLRVRLLKRDGSVDWAAFAPKAGEGKKVVLVACRKPEKPEELRARVREIMRPYLERP
ncbi:MAG: HD domain-containing protein [Candidatus Micrarchaeota archaeon]